MPLNQNYSRFNPNLCFFRYQYPKSTHIGQNGQMVHGLLLKVQRAEQENRSLRHLGRDNLLAYSEQRRAPQLQVDGLLEQWILPCNHVVQLGAPFRVLEWGDIDGH